MDIRSLWQSDLLDASFRGASFHVSGITDRGEKSLCVYEYPYRPGAEIEDLGRKARRIPVKALFFGPGYLGELQALIKALEEPGKGELIHPVFGSVEVAIAEWEIEHDAEHTDYAAVNFSCVEAVLDSEFFAASSSRQTAQSALGRLTAGLSEALAASTDAVVSTLSECTVLSSLAQSEVLATLNEVLDVYDSARSLTRLALSYISYPMGFVADLAAAVGLPLSAVSSVMGGYRDFVALSAAFPRLSAVAGLGGDTGGSAYATGAGGYSARWVSGGAAGRAVPLLAVESVSPVASCWYTPEPGGARTVRGAVVTHAMLAQTEALVGTASELLLAQLDTPTLTPQEVEIITGNGRQRMQDCMDYARAAYPAPVVYAVSEGMREASEGLQELGAAAIHARPPLIRLTTPAPGNLHLLAHRLYGDYTRAAEIQRINPHIHNPNFIAKGQELFVYAE